MKHSPLAHRIFTTIQSSQDPNGRVWLSYVLRNLCQSPEPESAILQALHTYEVWGTYERGKFVESVIAAQAKGQSLQHDMEISLDRLLKAAAEYAEREGTSEIRELHLAQAIVAVGGSLFPHYQLLAARFINTVRRFELPRERRCFVLMPFAEDFNIVYEQGIRPAIEAASVLCERADDSVRPGFVFGHIKESIRAADLIVADLTGLNPNVMLELGMAWGCEKPTVLISQAELSTLPFDLRPFRAVRYQLSRPGLDSLREWLTKSVKEVIQPGRVVPLVQAVPGPAGDLKLSMMQIQSEIAPKLAAEGYEVVYAPQPEAERYRKAGWLEVIWPNEWRKPCRLQTTEGHTVLRAMVER